MTINLSVAQIGALCNLIENNDNKFISTNDKQIICEYLKDSVQAYFKQVPFQAPPLYTEWLKEFELDDF